MRKYLESKVPDAVFIDAIYDECIIGIAVDTNRVIYSLRKCTETEMNIHKMDFNEAYMSFIIKANIQFQDFLKNQVKNVPIFCLDIQLPD